MKWDIEMVALLPLFRIRYDQLRENRVTTDDWLGLPVYAAKMLALNNWFILFLGLLQSTNSSKIELY